MKILQMMENHQLDRSDMDEKQRIYKNLEYVLVKNHISYQNFAIGIPDCDERYCFHEENGFWLIYFSERGIRGQFCIFSGLRDALSFYLLTVLDDKFSNVDLPKQIRFIKGITKELE